MYKSYFRRYQLVCRSYSFSLFTVAQNLSLTLFGKINSINKASKALGLIKKAATKGLKRRIFTSFLSLNSHSKTECRGFDPFCPCQSRRGLCIVRDDFFFLKSHRLAHAVAPPLPKKSLTFRGPHKFAAQPCGFEPFFFCCLILAHGLFCRILTPKMGADFPTGGIRLQRFRLLHHQ